MTARDQKIWVFNSGDAFSGNPKWLFLYVVNQRPEIEAHWLAHSQKTIDAVRALGYSAYRFDSIRGRELMSKAGVNVVNQVKEHFPEQLRGAVLLNLWHGVGVKHIERMLRPGNLSEPVARKYIQFNEIYRNTQLFLVTSPLMEQHFREQIGLDDEVIIRGGYPQNLYQKRFGEVRTFDHDIRARSGAPSDARIAVWCPTRRETRKLGLLREAFPHPEELIQTLEAQNTMLILKMHPLLEKDAEFLRLKELYGSSPWLYFWDSRDDIYEIFPSIDLAIVDYSSILYDMLAAGVTQVIRYVFDLEEGDSTVATALDYDALSCGPKAETFEELLALLSEDCTVDSDELARINDVFWAYSTPETFEVLVDRALEFRPRELQLPTLYSFDVFDTLIHRRGVVPVSVFYYVQTRARQAGGFPLFLVDNYPELRMQAEGAVRDTRRRTPGNLQTGLLEIHFSDIFDRIQSLYELTDEQRALLEQWEIEGELRSCIPDAAMIQRVRQLVGAGEKVILLSDMYLDLEVVTELLRIADPMLAELPLFLSNESGYQKTTRKLFIEAYREVGYDFADWVHVGDSPNADEKRPAELGIRSELIPKTALDGPFETSLTVSVPTYDGFLVAGIVRDLLRSRPFGLRDQFALEFVALNLIPYIDWVLRDSLARGYQTLYFVSRDGHHLKLVADALIAAHDYPLKTRYIYGSREAWRVASQVETVDADTFGEYGSLANTHSGPALLKAARLSVADFTTMFPEYAAFATQRSLTKKQVAEVVEVMGGSKDFNDHLLAVARAERELVGAYLGAHMNLDEPFAVVEYWGRGYTQDCLVRILGTLAGRPLATPFYYARSIYQTEGESIRHNYTASRQSLLAMEAVFANLPYGTVLGYERQGDEVVQIIEPRKHDVLLQRALENVLLEFAERFATTDFVDRDGVGRALHRFSFIHYKENRKEPQFVEVLGPLRDAVELGSKEIEFAPGYTAKDVLRHLRLGQFPKTRNPEISAERSTPLYRAALTINKRFRIKRRALAIARTIRDQRDLRR